MVPQTPWRSSCSRLLLVSSGRNACRDSLKELGPALAGKWLGDATALVNGSADPVAFELLSARARIERAKCLPRLPERARAGARRKMARRCDGSREWFRRPRGVRAALGS